MLSSKRIYLMFLVAAGLLSPSAFPSLLSKKLRSCESAVRAQIFDWNNLEVPVPPRISIGNFKRQFPDVAVFPNPKSPEEFEYQLNRSKHGDAFINIGRRVFYITRDPRNIEAVIPKPSDFIWISETRIQEFPDFSAFELTRLPYMGATVGEFNGRFGWDDGPNCWNFCQLYHGWHLNSQNVNILEHIHWLEKNPFFSPLGEYDPGMKLLPGDVIDIRLYRNGQRIGDGHAAINLNGALLVHKSGFKYHNGYEIRRIEEEFNFYRRVDRPGEVLNGRFFIYRPRAFSEVWGEVSPGLSPELVKLTQTMMDLEKLDRHLTLPDRMRPISLTEKQEELFRTLKQKIILKLIEVAPEIRKLGNIVATEGSSAQKTEFYFWQRIYFRMRQASLLKRESL